MVALRHRQHLQPQMAHLRRRVRAPRHTLRRVVRIAHVPRRIVVVYPHRHHRVLGYQHRTLVPEHALPVQVPVGNADQPLLRAVRQRGVAFDHLRQVMRVRINRQDVEVHRRAIFVGDQKVRFPRRNVQRAVVLQLDQHRETALRLVREVHPDHRIDRLLFSRRLQVNVEDQVHAGIRAPRHTVGFHHRTAARLPRKKMPVRLKALFFEDHVHAGKARAGRDSPAAAPHASGPESRWRDETPVDCPAGSRSPSPIACC